MPRRARVFAAGFLAGGPVVMEPRGGSFVVVRK